MRNTVLVAFLGVIVLGAPAMAGSAKKPAPVKKLNCGESYVVGTKSAPRTTLAQAQVDEVLKSKTADVEACWLKLPADQRKKDVKTTIELTIDDRGEVQTVELPALPDDVQRCVSVAATTWEFPSTDARADAMAFSYPIALHGK